MASRGRWKLSEISLLCQSNSPARWLSRMITSRRFAMRCRWPTTTEPSNSLSPSSTTLIPRRRIERIFLENNPFLLIEAFVSPAERLCAITDDWWVEYSYPLCMFTKEQLRVLEGRLAGPCQIHLGNAITVNTRMELMPCDMYIGTSLGKFGKEFSTLCELEELLKSCDTQDALNDIRKLPSTKCMICEYLDRCYGGCPVLWKNYSFDSLMSFKEEALVSDPPVC